jgi:hypothetical protein
MTRRVLLLVLLLIGSATGASAQTAHIWVDGSGTCVDNASPVVYDSATACSTIDAAWTAADAGDTVRVKAGSYNETPEAAVNGSAGNPITFIAESGVSVCGAIFSNNSYLRWIGFVFDGDICTRRARTIILNGTNDHMEFWHNTFQDGGDGISCQASMADRCNNSVFIGNVFVHLNVPSMGSGATGFVYAGSSSFIAYNDLSDVYCDSFAFNGTSTRWVNNYAHAMLDDTGCHSDYWQFGSHPLGLSNITLESNIQIGIGSGDEHGTIIQNYDTSRCTGGVIGGCGAVTEILTRRNVIHAVGAGGWSMAVADAGGPMTYFRMLHNTTVQAERTSASETAAHWFYTNVDYIYAYNNLEYESWGASATSGIGVWSANGDGFTFPRDYNLAYDPDGSVTFAAFWTSQSNEQSNVNPNLVNVAAKDFHLGAGSGDGLAARGTGGPLCLTSGSGTGTTFNVASGCGGWFRGDDTNLDQYSGNLIVGDTITVGGDVVEIASISADAITVTSSFTWGNAESVFYGSDATPDIGAYPYKAGGYTLSATYSCSGGTCTVTPNDASLVRFVVCYEDGVPYVVDNASTYTCTDPSGTLDVRVYPLYASTTLWAVATDAGVPVEPDATPRRFRFVMNFYLLARLLQLI